MTFGHRERSSGVRYGREKTRDLLSPVVDKGLVLSLRPIKGS